MSKSRYQKDLLSVQILVSKIGMTKNRLGKPCFCFFFFFADFLGCFFSVIQKQGYIRTNSNSLGCLIQLQNWSLKGINAAPIIFKKDIMTRILKFCVNVDSMYQIYHLLQSAKNQCLSEVLQLDLQLLRRQGTWRWV